MGTPIPTGDGVTVITFQSLEGFMVDGNSNPKHRTMTQAQFQSLEGFMVDGNNSHSKGC